MEENFRGRDGHEGTEKHLRRSTRVQQKEEEKGKEERARTERALFLPPSEEEVKRRTEFEATLRQEDVEDSRPLLNDDLGGHEHFEVSNEDFVGSVYPEGTTRWTKYDITDMHFAITIHPRKEEQRFFLPAVVHSFQTIVTEIIAKIQKLYETEGRKPGKDFKRGATRDGLIYLCFVSRHLNQSGISTGRMPLSLTPEIIAQKTLSKLSG